MERKDMMKLFGARAVHRVCVCFAYMIILACFASPLFGSTGDVSLSVNGKAHKFYSFEELLPYSYPLINEHPLQVINPIDQSDSYLFGITLDELFPILIDAWKLTVLINGRGSAIDNPMLAEELGNLAIVIGYQDKTGTVDLLDDTIVIDIAGEQSTDRIVEIWLSWEGVEQLKDEIQRFADMHDITVKSLEVPKISSKLIQTQRGGGSLPDVVMVQSDYIDELVQANTIQALDYLKLDGFSTAGIDSFNLYRRQWAIPFYFDSQAIICNGDVFSRIGLNANDIRTLDDLEQAAAAVKTYAATHSVPIVPMSWNLYSAYWLLPFQYGFGKTHLIESDGTVDVADKPTVEAMEYLISLLDRSLLSANERDAMLSNFITGKTAMMLSASYMIGELERLGLSFFIVPFPVNQKTGAKIAPILDYKGFAITKRSKNPILARRLIQYLTGIGVQQRFTTTVNKLPALELAMQIDQFDSQIRKAVKLSAAGGQCLPPDPAYGIYKNVLWSMIRLIIDRKFTVSDGLKEAQRLIDAQVQDVMDQLPDEYKSVYATHEGETHDEKTDVETVDDAADTDSGGFFKWLRNLW